MRHYLIEKNEVPDSSLVTQVPISTRTSDNINAEGGNEAATMFVSLCTDVAEPLDRLKAINASTQEYQYAAYLEAWRSKVEKIGNLNYPDEAKRNKLHGNLLMHVAVRADGSVEQIRVVRSSGHRLLDDAAVRIVRLSAPFAPFPPEIRKNVDVLDITRTWQFLDGGTLFSSN